MSLPTPSLDGSRWCFPWIDHRRVGVFEILDVAGDEDKVVDNRSGGDQAVKHEFVLSCWAFGFGSRRLSRGERLAIMLAGYVLASAAAGGAMSILGVFQSLLTMPINPDPVDVPLLRVFSDIVMLAGIAIYMSLWWALAIGIFAFLPSALLIGMGEFLSIRLSWYYAFAGAAAGVVAAPAASYLIFPNSDPLTSPDILGLTGMAGFVGGLAYWRFAGRDARGPIALCASARSWLHNSTSRN